MAQDIIIGRDDEQKTIKNYIDSKKAELIAVYGRRRVGSRRDGPDRVRLPRQSGPSDAGDVCVPCGGG